MKKIFDVVKLIESVLRKENIEWVIGGSTSLLLQGIEISVSDIDILTDREGAFRIYEILGEYGTKPVAFSEKERTKSYWGKLSIDDVEIDLMGDFCKKVDGEWVNFSMKRIKDKETVNLDGVNLPVTKLESHLELYKIMKREKDIEKIKQIEKILSNK
ncbi:MAG: hypothetical protein V1818_00720 [Candidatus Aenigmatarchaeota archaeon]